MQNSQAKEIQSQVAAALSAAEDKKGENISVLQMDKSSSAFTDYFVIASGTNPKQVQAIADEIELRLKRAGTYPNSVEGYKQAEWILLDYVHFVVHVFSENARKFYDLERLWKSAKRINAGDLLKTTTNRTALASGSASDGAGTRKRPKPVKSAAMKSTGKAIRVATSRTRTKKSTNTAKTSSKAKPAAKSKSGSRSKSKAKTKARKSR
jgi:ribosome-associated protein